MGLCTSHIVMNPMLGLWHLTSKKEFRLNDNMFLEPIQEIKKEKLVKKMIPN
jgi:hypothetical protein